MGFFEASNLADEATRETLVSRTALHRNPLSSLIRLLREAGCLTCQAPCSDATINQVPSGPLVLESRRRNVGLRSAPPQGNLNPTNPMISRCIESDAFEEMQMRGGQGTIFAAFFND